MNVEDLWEVFKKHNRGKVTSGQSHKRIAIDFAKWVLKQSKKE